MNVEFHLSAVVAYVHWIGTENPAATWQRRDFTLYAETVDEEDRGWQAQRLRTIATQQI